MNQSFIAIFILLLTGLGATSLSQTQPGISGWVDKQIDATLQKEQVGLNGKGSDRQRESPSADPRSTSLVDQPSATEFFSVATSIIPVMPGLPQVASSAGSTNSDSGAAGSTTATATAYALLTAFNKVSPTDPDFYAQHVLARRVSFTVGTAASKVETDNTNAPATVYGTKVLLIDSRELYSAKNLNRLRDVQHAVSVAAKQSAFLKAQIKELIFKSLNPNSLTPEGRPDPLAFIDFDRTHFSTDEAFASTYDTLDPETRKRIQALITDTIDTFSRERKALQDTYDAIRKGQQLSISYTADIRDAKGNNEHRVEMIFDYGLSPHINWTLNASGDYTDRKSALDSKGGRIATSFAGDLTKSDSAWGKTPIRLSFSGEGRWQTAQRPQYTFESKLTIPLATGLDLPIVYRYANRIAQIDQTDSEARLGISVDLSRLAQAFK